MPKYGKCLVRYFNIKHKITLLLCVCDSYKIRHLCGWRYQCHTSVGKQFSNVCLCMALSAYRLGTEKGSVQQLQGYGICGLRWGHCCKL